jgi:Rps23 Pro-64 3,4-dihydroxylase Tpa1-like proline 4-hydroxylase
MDKAALVGTALYVGGTLLNAYADLENRANCKRAKAFSNMRVIKDEKRLKNDLNTNGIFVLDDVLTPKELSVVSQELKALDLHFEAQNKEYSETRQDRVIWVRNHVSVEQHKKEMMQRGVLEQGSLEKVLSKILSKNDHQLTKGGLSRALDILQSIANTLVECQYTSMDLVVPMNAQLAAYSRGGGYLAHRDTCNSSVYELGLYQYFLLRRYRRRRFTAILYLNIDNDAENSNFESIDSSNSHESSSSTTDSSWNIHTDGGALRCFIGAAPSDVEGVSAAVVRDIAPTGGRLVIFDSSKTLHQVLPMFSDRNRIALTIWIEEK